MAVSPTTTQAPAYCRGAVRAARLAAEEKVQEEAELSATPSMGVRSMTMLLMLTRCRCSV